MTHIRFMEEALLEAEAAYSEEEVPIGAVIVFDNRIISRAHNRVRQLKDPTAHAELLAIREAALALDNERMSKCSIYVNLEPCPMCMGALLLARVEGLVYGASDPKAGACGSVVDLVKAKFNHRPRITGGVLEDRSVDLLQKFFLERRGVRDGEPEGKKRR